MFRVAVPDSGLRVWGLSRHPTPWMQAQAVGCRETRAHRGDGRLHREEQPEDQLHSARASALALSIWSHQLGQPGLVPAPDLAGVEDELGCCAQPGTKMLFSHLSYSSTSP